MENIFKPEDLRKRIEYHLKKTMGLGLKGILSIEDAVKQKLDIYLYKALSLSIRDRIMDAWIATNQEYKNKKIKKLYYLSAEYLTGRFLGNNLINIGIWNNINEIIKEMGIDLNAIENQEIDAGLGNGGLGRLAACFLDSLAALELPAQGYGLRYDYGIFRQKILDGYQIEYPDHWLKHGNQWEILHKEDELIVKFGGHIQRVDFFKNKEKSEIVYAEEVLVVPYDIPIIGFKNGTINTLRLWSTSIPDYTSFNIKAFDSGDYDQAFENVLNHDNLTMVSILYPNDNHDSGKLLRLKQQYILVSASMQDIFRNFENTHDNINQFHLKTAIQINDTHPSLIISELMRILVDEKGVDWDSAWKITVQTCGYTNHTVLSEALEQWDVSMMKKLLPRNFEILELINLDFCKKITINYPKDIDRVRRMSIIENSKVRMAHLAIVGSHSVNGVAELHTEILKTQLFRDFHEMFPDKFNNKTNGIVHRRWLLKSNPLLSALITEKIGDNWQKDLYELKKLEQYVDDLTFLEKLIEVKQKNKEKLKNYVAAKNKVKGANGEIIDTIIIDTNSIFDIQAKRLHEYKRQLMNALHILMVYNELKTNPDMPYVPRTFFFAAKSAPGYFQAKAIIKFINILAGIINNDRSIGNKIKIVFLENYSVSLAELLLSAGDVSEQISTAGLEASGTGNMKLALNGALTIGTMDGANVEMSEEIGEENMFIFGMRVDDIKALREKGYHPREIYDQNPAIQTVINQLWSGKLASSPKEQEILKGIAESLVNQDRFFILKDLSAYKTAQEKVSLLYQDKRGWAKKTLLNIARMGKFSSDRAINQYNDEIWKLKKVTIPELIKK